MISVIGVDGVTIATVRVDISVNQTSWQAAPGSNTPNALMSRTSASRSRLYYLNGGSEVRFLGVDGSRGTATEIKLGSFEQAGFAVSPDDSRIAVAIFTYVPPPAASPGSSPTYKGMRLYVEDLLGGGHHVDLFSSSTVAEFPVGWTGGRLILAVASPLCCQQRTANPYGATEYHVADPATGARLATLCAGSLGPEGPVEPAGAFCFENGSGPVFQHWDGSTFAAPAAIPSPDNYNALSPDGTMVAVGGDPIHVFGPAGHDDAITGQGGYVFGWLDGSHLMIQRQNANGVLVLDLRSRSSVSLTTAGTYMGALPTALS